MRKKQTKKQFKKWLKQARKKTRITFDSGQMKPEKARILMLIVSVVLMSSWIVVTRTFFPDENIQNNQIVAVKRNAELEKEIKKMVQGYPIESMSSYIADKDPKVAVFMVAIAKKESAWGKRSPVLNGEDCYNYWGFRFKSDRLGSGGHTCFDTPKEAVDAVASRIEELVIDEKLDTPKEMIVWKCGYGCQNMEKTESEQKWISDVNIYYRRLSEYL